MPHRWRNHAIAVAIVGVPIGGMLGASVAAHVVGAYGWRGMFILGGILPIVAVALTLFALPESPRYLTTRKNRWPELASLLNRITASSRYSDRDHFELKAIPSQASSGLRLLFSGEFVLDTTGVWLIFFSNLFSAFTFLSWTPVILTALGLQFSVAMKGLLFFNFAGIVGAALTAWIIPYRGSRSALIVLSMLATASLLFISRIVAGHSGADAAHMTLLMAGFAAAGFSLIGIQVAAYGLSAHVYPTEIRSAGIGWAAAVGRLGSILSTFVSGIAFLWLKGPGLFAALSVIVGLTLIGAVLVRSHMRN
jgi:AAHS family 4-hydroxybenzoate transporter-like MFS transporter